MKKVFIFAMLMSVTAAMGQVSHFGSQGQAMRSLSLEELTGHTAQAYNLMRQATSSRVVCMHQSEGEIPADKAEIILEAHHVFGEYSTMGFQMLLDSDHSVYGEYIYDWAGGYFDSYDYFEYRIPENADASETTTNVVLDGEEAIQVPAGVYDFMILYPCPGEGLIFASGEYGKYDDFEFKGGCSYRFVVEYDEWDNNGFVGYFPVAKLFADIDMALTSLTLPANGMDITAAEDITITIVNRGKEDVTQCEVSYQIEGCDAVTETITTTIAPGEELVYTFAAKADMSAEQEYVVTAQVTLEDDMIPGNNSLSGKCKHVGVSQLPYHYDFSQVGAEALTADWTVQNVNGDYSTWEYNEWTEDTNGDMGVVSCSGCWEGDMTGNDNLISAPLYFSAGDNYIKLNTKCINAEYLELLDVLYGPTTNVDEMTTIAELQVKNTEWQENIINFNVPAEGIYYVALHVHSVDGANVFVDEITVDAGVCEVTPSLRIDRVVLPYSNCDLSDESVVGVTVTNVGTGPTSTFTLTYAVEENDAVLQLFTDVLNPMESGTYYFDSKADFSEIGDYMVTVTARCGEVVESEVVDMVTHYEPITELPFTTVFNAGENLEDYWLQMTPDTWEYDDMFGSFSSLETGLENGLLSRCYELSGPVRIKVQYSSNGWMQTGFYVAYGKADADVEYYTKVYEDVAVSSDKEVEFVVPIETMDNYSFVIVCTGEDGASVRLGELTISELLPNDLRLCSVQSPLSAYTPLSQMVGEATFVAEVNNRGTAAMNGVKATLYCNDELIATSADACTMQMDEVAYIPVTATLPLCGIGDNVDFTVKLISDEEDQYMGDNEMNLPTVHVTDTVYATENLEVMEGGTGSWGAPIGIGNVYELLSTDILSSITVGWAMGDNELVAKPIGIAVYSVNEDMTLGRLLYTATEERAMEGLVTYELDPMQLSPGKYFIEVQQLSTYNMGLGCVADESAYCYMNDENTLALTAGLSLAVRANFGHNAVAYEHDMAVVEMVAPVKRATLFTSDETISILFKNMGATAAECSAVCKVNDTEYTAPLSLLPYETGVVDFEHINMEAVGDYVVEVTVDMESDENLANNTLVETLASIEESNPFVMNFEDCYDFDAAPDCFNPRWRTVDRIGAPTDYFWMFEHPYRGEPVGFIAFNINATEPVITEDNLPGFYPHSGERFGVAFCAGYDAPADTSDIWLISPQLTLGDNTSLELYVKTRMLETYDQKEEPYSILISDSDDAFDSFTVVGDEVRTAPVDEWQHVTADLSDYDNKDVYVAIRYRGVRLENVCFMIDDIEIKGDNIGGVTDVAVANVAMRYNANEEVISVTSPCEITRVELFNVQGQTVYATDVTGHDSYRFSVAGNVAGIYICKVYTANGTAVQKFVVR